MLLDGVSQVRGKYPLNQVVLRENHGDVNLVHVERRRYFRADEPAPDNDGFFSFGREPADTLVVVKGSVIAYFRQRASRNVQYPRRSSGCEKQLGIADVPAFIRFYNFF